MVAMTLEPTDEDYINSIEDSFFKSVAQQVVNIDTATTITDGEKAASANTRLEDMEITVRRKLLELLLVEGNNLEASDCNGNDLKRTTADAIGIFWKSTLDLCHHLVHHALRSRNLETKTTVYEHLASCRRLPYILLSDCVDGLPSLEDVQHFWSTYVEPSLVNRVLFGDKFWCRLTKENNSNGIILPNSHLPFLKVANQFLKRLGHTSDTAMLVEWKGRILWALARGFSVADKSSLKLWGNFHTSNLTDFENEEEFNQIPRAVVSNSANAVDYSLYEAMWSLQTDFANPNKINVREFIRKLKLVLAAMESASTTTCTDSTVALKRDDDQIENIATTKNTTKYLTSSALLPSQIEDPVFRSNIVTQLLIVGSHLGSESPPLKNALSSILGRARKLLKNDNPQLHDILWGSILANGRENDWRTWKKQKCSASAFAPKFQRKHELVLDSDSTDGSNRQRKRKEPFGKNGQNIKTSEKTVCSTSNKFLGNNDLQNLKDNIPTLEVHLEPYVEALDPESGIEDEYHPKNDSLFTWRAMRLYAKHKLPLMNQCRKPADLEKITRKWYRLSHGKDIPGGSNAIEESDGNNDDGKKNDSVSSEIRENIDHQKENSSEGKKTSIEKIDPEKASEDVKDISDGPSDSNMADVSESVETNENTNGKNEDDTNDSNMAHVNENNDTEENNINLKKDEPDDSKMADVDDSNGTDTNGDSKTVNANNGDGNKMNTFDKNEDDTNETKMIDANDSNDNDNRKKTDTPDAHGTKKIEGSKQPSTKHSDQKKGSDDRHRNYKSNNKNIQSNQVEENRVPRETHLPQNRVGGGRRGDLGGRNNQERGRRDDGGRNNQEYGRRNDSVQQRRWGEDLQQSRGRPGGDASYRGRSDGPPARREGGRYDDDYRGDNRGQRFDGERGNRSGDRDNYRGGDRGGGSGRGDDHRGGERNRRNNESRPYGGGNIRRRR